MKKLKSKEDIDDARIEKFTILANRPKRWFGKANQLMNSADFLEKNDFLSWETEEQKKISEEDILKFYFSDTYQMLRAMALECYMKGALLSHDVELFKNGKLKGAYKNHDLVKYAGELKLKLSDDEIRILKYMRFYIYNGRFPVSSSFDSEDSIPRHPFFPKESKLKGVIWTGPFDEDLLKEIIAKVKNCAKADIAQK